FVKPGNSEYSPSYSPNLVAYTDANIETRKAADKEWKCMPKTGSEIALVSSDYPEKELRYSDFPVVLLETMEIFVGDRGKLSSGGLVVRS
ncbi:hypothetical protein TorRG33x02_140520, partial [Trema orientale]